MGLKDVWNLGKSRLAFLSYKIVTTQLSRKRILYFESHKLGKKQQQLLLIHFIVLVKEYIRTLSPRKLCFKTVD